MAVSYPCEAFPPISCLNNTCCSPVVNFEIIPAKVYKHLSQIGHRGLSSAVNLEKEMYWSSFSHSITVVVLWLFTRFCCKKNNKIRFPRAINTVYHFGLQYEQKICTKVNTFVDSLYKGALKVLWVICIFQNSSNNDQSAKQNKSSAY